MTVLVAWRPPAHDARLVDYDCQTGVAVLKIDKVSGLPTLAFADPDGAGAGPGAWSPSAVRFDGGAVTPGYVSAMHQVGVDRQPDPPPSTRVELSDTIQTDAR